MSLSYRHCSFREANGNFCHEHCSVTRAELLAEKPVLCEGENFETCRNCKHPVAKHTNPPPQQDSTEVLLAKKRKSVEEAARVKDTCPTFFDESLLVAEQLDRSKAEISALKSQNLSLLNDILCLNETKAHFEKERSTLFRDACAL